jgi:hypothetical protein
MPTEPDPALTNNLIWAGQVWNRLTHLQCAGILHIALRYPERQEHTNSYIDVMANAAWTDLGRPLQLDVTRALLDLRTAFGR